MAWGMTAALLAAPYVYSGVSGLLGGRAQAEAESATSVFNANAISDAGDVTAGSILATAEIKGGIATAATKANIARRRAVNEFNAEQAFIIGHVNSDILEREARLVWEQAGLDLRQLDESKSSTIGRMRVSHGASGAIMDQDASRQAQDAVLESYELQKFIVRRGADIKALKLLDQAALSEWQGAQEANKIIFEGELLNQSESINTALSVYGTNVQAGIDSKMVDYNSSVQSYQALVLGSQRSAAAERAGQSAFVSGMFGAATSVGATYLRNATPSDSGSLLATPLGFGDRTSIPGGMGGV